jgi:hypothetical protein
MPTRREVLSDWDSRRQARKRFERRNDLETFVADVNKSLQHFAPAWMGGTYERIKSDYVYQKDDLQITYNGESAVVRWKKGEYAAPAIWSAVAEWSRDLNVVTSILNRHG